MPKRNGVKLVPLDPAAATVLAGAGASVDAGVPAALPILNELVRSLVASRWARETLVARSQRARPGASFLRFETLVLWINEVFDESLGCFGFLDRYNVPGPVHQAIALAALDGLRIMTVNFDDLLEQAVLETGRSATTVDAHRVDAVAWGDADHVPVVRLHGTRRVHRDGTVTASDQAVQATTVAIATTSPGTELSAQAAKVLHEAVDGRHLLVLGYSASDDLDVVPTLQDATPSEVTWIEHDGGRPRLVADPHEPGAVGVVQAMRALGIPVRVVRGSTSTSLTRLGLSKAAVPGTRPIVAWRREIRRWAAEHRWQDPTGLGFASLVLGDIGDHDLALRAQRQSRPSVNTGSWPRSRRSYEIGQTLYLQDDSDLKGARRWARRARVEGAADGDDQSSVFATLLLGRIAFIQQNYSDARSLFAEVANDPSVRDRDRSFARCWLGRAEQWSGRPEAALPLLTEALSEFMATGDTDGIVDTRHALGLVRRDLGLPGAVDDLRASAKLSGVLGWHEREMTACCEVGRTLYWSGDLKGAQEVLIAALRLAPASDEIADLYHAVARLRLEQDRCCSALKWLHRALDSTTTVTRVWALEIRADVAATHLSLGHHRALVKAVRLGRTEPTERASWWGRAHLEVVATLAASMGVAIELQGVPRPSGPLVTRDEANLALARLVRWTGVDLSDVLSPDDIEALAEAWDRPEASGHDRPESRMLSQARTHASDLLLA